MSPAESRLFQPWETPWGRFRNRLVMAPMTRSMSPGGVPGENVAEHYRLRAAGGIGLIVTEGTLVDHPAATNDRAVPHCYGEKAMAGWKRVVEAVHGEGSRIIPQLWHVGAVRRAGDEPNPDVPGIGPSGLSLSGKKACHEMNQIDIDAVVAAFGSAAAEAKAAGFDGVEVHGAHSYLIDQFFAADTNRRTDGYGGSLVERTRFACEIIAAVRDAVGPDFMLVLRFSQWKQQDYHAKLAHDPDELEAFLEPLCDAGVDVFHASTRRFWEPEFEGSDLNLAGWARKLTGRPSITVGSVGLDREFTATFDGSSAKPTPIDALVERLERDEFDAVAVGRALMADAEWAEKMRTGRFAEITGFTREAIARYP